MIDPDPILQLGLEIFCWFHDLNTLLSFDIILPYSVIDLSRVNSFLVFDPTPYTILGGWKIINLFVCAESRNLTATSLKRDQIGAVAGEA